MTIFNTRNKKRKQSTEFQKLKISIITLEPGVHIFHYNAGLRDLVGPLSRISNSIINNDPISIISDVAMIGRMKNMKVLVVDDDPDITSLYKDALEGEGGFNVDTYNDPSQALSDFKPDYYDISLIDVRMPSMDGFDLYKELKKLDPVLKVCFITGFEVNYKALQEIFPGIAQECYISKPTTMKELKEHVDHLLHE